MDTYDPRITKKAPYGRHIGLRCRNHPELTWSTKNISPIGCRTLFYNLGGYPDAPPECACPMRDLEVIPIEGPDVPE